jgi:NACHT domain/Restriction endonuclease
MSGSPGQHLVTQIAGIQSERLAVSKNTVELPSLASADSAVRTLLDDHEQALLLGEPGAGKTTLLTRLAVRQQHEVLQSTDRPGALFIKAHDLSRPPGWQDALLAYLMNTLSIDVDRDVLFRVLADGRLGLVVDGFDEISPVDGSRLGNELAASIAREELPVLLISSRTVGAPSALLRRMTVVRLQGLDRASSLRLLDSVLVGHGRNAEELYDLSGGNPLMLAMLGRVWARRAELPRSRVKLYGDAIEGLLSVLVERIGWPADGSPPTVGSVLAAHGDLAMAMLREDVRALPQARAAEIFARHLSANQADALLTGEDGGANTLLTHRDPDAVLFSHRLFLEFLAASVAYDDPDRLRELASLPSATESLAMALALSGDPASGLIALGECPGLSSLERLVPHLGEIPDGAVERARQALSDRIARILSTGNRGSVLLEAELPTPADGSPPDGLLARWFKLETSDADGYERGLELESFMVDFFGRFFEVVEHDYRTKTGQIDILLENVQSNPFWLGHDADIYVECKNTRSAVGLGPINDFAGKLATDSATLAFFVSQAGFKSTAWDRLRNAAQDQSQTSIVPVTGVDIRRTLEDGEDPERFFKNLVRDTKHGRIF